MSCSELQCVAVCCSVLQCVAVSWLATVLTEDRDDVKMFAEMFDGCVAVCCSVLQCGTLRRSSILPIAPVQPVPVKRTASRLFSQPRARRTMERASARNSVVCIPVAEAVVCVLAYTGSTSVRTKSSIPSSARPDACTQSQSEAC